jgi:hypothetical protein
LSPRSENNMFRKTSVLSSPGSAFRAAAVRCEAGI